MRLLSIGAGALCAVILFRPFCGAASRDGGFVLYPGKPGETGPVVFSHRTHDLRGAGFECTKCHTPDASNTTFVEMNSIRQGQACGSCHDGKTRGPRNSATALAIKECSACHMPTGDVTIKLNRMDPVAFSHIRHLGADSGQKSSKIGGFSCGDCHPKPFERSASGPIGMEVPHETGGCTSCHNGKNHVDGKTQVFAATTRCLTCHKPPSQLPGASGTGSAVVEPNAAY